MLDRLSFAQEHELDASQTYFGSPCTERVASIESRTFIPDQTKEAFENAYSKVIEIELQALRAVDDARSCTDAGPQPPQTSFAGRTNHHGPVEIPSAFKRMLVVPEALGGVARFSFDQLCGYGYERCVFGQQMMLELFSRQSIVLLLWQATKLHWRSGLSSPV